MSLHLSQFLGQILARPQEVGAILPSSSFLGREMTDGLGVGTGPVIELGPGPGAITQAILGRGVPASDIHAVEMNPTFCDILARRCPGVRIYPASATDLVALNLPRVSTIVSSLPLRSIPADVVLAIMVAAHDRLLPGGRILQFTYGMRQPVASQTLDELGLACISGPKVWRNLPPARVFSFQRAV